MSIKAAIVGSGQAHATMMGMEESALGKWDARRTALRMKSPMEKLRHFSDIAAITARAFGPITFSLVHTRIMHKTKLNAAARHPAINTGLA
jgi:hypothetical protein